MKFIYLKRRGGDYFYARESEIAEINDHGGSARLRDGTRADFVHAHEAQLLLAADNGLIRGVCCDTGDWAIAPIGSIDSVREHYDDAAKKWIATATTRGGVRFLVCEDSRRQLGLDEVEMEDFEDLAERARKIRGDIADPAAEAAVSEAEEAAGGLQRKAV